MATWIYEARTGDGRVVRGTRDAADRRSALEALRSEGFFVSRIEARGAHTTAPPLRPRANPLDADQAAPVAASPGATSATSPAATSATSPALSETVTLAPSAQPVAGAGPTVSVAPAQRPARPRFDPDLTPPTSPAAVAGTLRPAGQTVAPPLARQPFLQASRQDLSNFFRQLAALMHAGTGIGIALQTVAQNSGNNALRAAGEQMARRAMTGEPLSQSMSAFPGLFSPLMIGITGAGERGGFLETAFARLADYAERDHQLEQAIKRETWYPKLIVFCAILIPGAVPLVLQGFGAFLAQIGPPLLLIALLFAAWRTWLLLRPALSQSLESFKIGNASPLKLYDEIKLRIPIVGKTARALASAKFCRALSALYSAGVGPGEAVRLGAQACGNRAIADRALATVPRLNAGAPLTQCMEETQVFNPLALQMMRVGEESGDLDTQLDKAADFLETNAETTIKQAVPALGIVAFLAVALYVGSLVVQMWSGYTNELGGLMND